MAIAAATSEGNLIFLQLKLRWRELGGLEFIPSLLLWFSCSLLQLMSSLYSSVQYVHGTVPGTGQKEEKQAGILERSWYRTRRYLDACPHAYPTSTWKLFKLSLREDADVSLSYFHTFFFADSKSSAIPNELTIFDKQQRYLKLAGLRQNTLCIYISSL
jgi:hypothetical protein